jgi:heat shock protein HslJ
MTDAGRRRERILLPAAIMLLAACAGAGTGAGAESGGDTGAAATSGESAVPALAGTSWRLEDLAGAGVIDDARASLEFSDGGPVSGSATCNRFTGTATLTGNAISFGPLATTRKACPEALMSQETRYLQALEAAQRVEVKDSLLYLHTAGGAAPLRFVRE